MLVFLDFEASSLGKKSYPIEVAWVFEDGTSDAFLIRPAPEWTDWDSEAEAVHHIPRQMLLTEGVVHHQVAQAMVERLTGHDLLASAPSWDGKWLSTLLRAAGLPRHSLRLRDTDDAHRECAEAILKPILRPEELHGTVGNLLALTEIRDAGDPPAHRALADALEEQQRWLAVGDAARRVAKRYLDGLKQN